MGRLGVDTGGTFTDFVYLDEAGIRVHKVLSTPHAPEEAIVRGIREMGLAVEGLHVVHGSTVGTNAVLEGKGVRTAYITNRGFGDVLAIGRQARDVLYDLQPPPRRAPVPAQLCLETGGRLGADGRVLEPLSEADLAELRARLLALRPQAVAINLLFSFLEDGLETALSEAVPEGIFVSRSSDVLPELREYERGVATWLNSYVGPIMAGYLRRLAEALPGARLSVMQSHGSAIAASHAAGRAVHLLLSGPAGGLRGVLHAGRAAQRLRMLSFDMGGTSTDVALLDHRIRLTTEGRIAGYPVAVPMVDMHTIGAGGGSLARVDAGGLLQVGPQSAGADPGPVCYGRGGVEPTVTDANVVLGRLPAWVRLGDRLRLDREAALRALGRLGEQLGLDAMGAARGVLRVANEHMAQALRVITVQRGVDPRGYTLASFGGAGGLHVCELAEALGMREALVPVHGGVLSALGMLVAAAGRQLSHSANTLLERRDDAWVTERLDRIAARGQAELRAEGAGRLRREDSLDLRYEGQSYTLRIPWLGMRRTIEAFHEAHRREYGHALDMPVELVNLRVGLSEDVPAPALPPYRPAGPPEPVGESAVAGIGAPVPVFPRARVPRQAPLTGPLIVIEAVGTTWVAPGWRVQADEVGNLLLRRDG